jgi:hypothetical protein
VASDAIGIDSAMFRFDPIFELDFMLPWYVKVILLGETRSFPNLQLAKPDIWRSSSKFQGPVMNSAETEFEQMNSLPAHRHLKNAVKLS